MVDRFEWRSSTFDKIKKSRYESEEKYRLLFEHTGESLFVAQDGQIVFHNPRTTELTGYSTEEFQSKPFFYFIHEDDREMVMDYHVRRLRGEELPERYAFRIIHKNGSLLWAELNAVIIQWNGKPAVLCFMSDITEQRQAEAVMKKNLSALTQPMDSTEGIGFEDLFNPAEIQRLQDEFSWATSVASIITRPDGTPITKPSNFSRLCRGIIRKTEKGLINCCKSDAILGRPNPDCRQIKPA